MIFLASISFVCLSIFSSLLSRSRVFRSVCHYCGLLITHGGICTCPGALFICYAPCMCFASALHPLYMLPIVKRLVFILNLPAILNLIWPSHPPFIGACEQPLPMNILLHVHYAMYVLYSQPTRLSIDSRSIYMYMYVLAITK